MTHTRDIQADHAIACAMFDDDRQAILESVSCDVWWDVAAEPTVDAAVMVAMSDAWDAVRGHALGLAFEALRGTMTDTLPYGTWEDEDTPSTYGNYVSPIRASATVATLVASGAAYVAGMGARAAHTYRVEA